MTKPTDLTAEEKPQFTKYDRFFAVCFNARARARLEGFLDGSILTALQYEMTVIAESLIENLEREAAVYARRAQERSNEIMLEMFKAMARVR